LSATLSSIARPDGFDRSVSEAGVRIALSIRFPDHHIYRRRDLDRIGEAVSAAGVTGVVTTEKDWVKLREWELPCACAVARLELVVDDLDILPMIEKPQAVPAASSRA
jgi:tetraacyldisaccharide 4'-kinase